MPERSGAERDAEPARPHSDRTGIERFRSIVREFSAGSSRPMPWRETDDPYRIMVSEFMLQQTQVSRVEPKYHSFLSVFPTVHDLAAASLKDVLVEWQGLGYNRRAKCLRDAAAQIAGTHDGVVPCEMAELRALSGVGAYTASAIAAFAYQRPVVVLETNIRRVFLHHFFAGRTDVHDRQIEPLVAAALPRTDVRHWYYALMDYGAMLGRLRPNANRRSRHYTRQSPFAGSVREVRGRIIAALSTRGTIALEDLVRDFDSTARLAPALEGLERDGMVVIESNRVALR